MSLTNRNEEKPQGRGAGKRQRSAAEKHQRRKARVFPCFFRGIFMKEKRSLQSKTINRRKEKYYYYVIYDMCRNEISLPLHDFLSEDDVKYICEYIKKLI